MALSSRAVPLTLMLVSLGFLPPAQASVVTYTFTADGPVSELFLNGAVPTGESQFSSSGVMASGSFNFDSEAPPLPPSTPAESLYDAVSDFQATWPGNTLSSPTGYAAVSFDSVHPVGDPSITFSEVQLSPDGLSAPPIVIGARTYALSGVALIWQTGLSDASLPATLPPTGQPLSSSSFQPRYKSTASYAGDPLEYYFAVFPNLTITVVPLPPAASLFSAGLAVLLSRRRRG